MNISTHSHRLTIPRQIAYFTYGLFFSLFSLGFAIAYFPYLLSGKENIFFVVSAVVTVFVTLPFGIIFILMSIFTRVIISSDVLEYHTPALIVSAKWQDIKRIEQQKSGVNYSVVIPVGGVVKLRAWARLVSSLFRKDAATFYIDTSKFRNADGHSLESDVVICVSSPH